MSDRTDIEIPATGLLPEDHTETAPAADRLLTAREIAMQNIVAKRQRSLEAEMEHWQGTPTDEPDVREQHAATRRPNAGLGEVEEDRDYQDPYAVEERPEVLAPPVASPVPEAIAGGASPAREPASVASPHTFAVDVDGQQLHVTQEQLVQLARMGAVANQALYRYQMNGQTGYVGLTPQVPPASEAPKAPTPIIDDERIKGTVKAIQYGDEATAAQALSDLVTHVVSRNAAPQSSLDPVAIGNYAAQRAIQAAKLEHETQIIRQEYADIMADPDLAHLAALKVAQLRQRNQTLGQQQSDLDVFREAGNLVLDKIGKPRPGQQVQPPADAGLTAPQASNLVIRRSTAEIEGRKRAAPRATSQVIDRRSAAPQAPRPPSGADIVEMMRKSRGQTSMR